MKRVLTFFLTLALCAGLAVPVLAAEFSDVPAGYAFHQAIQDCVAKGILTGYDDGTFRPGEGVTRAQFCVMLARAFYPGEDANYSALKSSAWFAPGAAVLESHGAMAYGKTYWYDPAVMNSQISRNDMARFIANVMKAKGFTVSEADKNAAQANIADYASIPESFRDPIKTVFALGIITGYAGNTFEGGRTMTRGQAAVIIQRMSRCLSGESARPEETPTTLTNGKAVTEENVLAMLAELKARYPEGTDFSAGYSLGNDSPVRRATFPYERAENPTTHTSNIEGCGGWATLLSDAMLGQAGFEPRKTTLADARPGDIMIQVDQNGRLVHVAMITSRPAVSGGKTAFTVTEAATDDQDVYHLHWDVDYSRYTGSAYRYDVYTRYPR